MEILTKYFDKVERDIYGNIISIRFKNSSADDDRRIHKELCKTIKHGYNFLGYYLHYSDNYVHVKNSLHTIFSYLGFDTQVENTQFILTKDKLETQKYCTCVDSRSMIADFTTDPQYPHNINNFKNML
jgi:hypothetical protein